MTGAVATIAVAPQTPVPIAIKYAMFDDMLSFFIINLTKSKTANIQTRTRGIATLPNLNNSSKLSLIPSNITPNLRM